MTQAVAYWLRREPGVDGPFLPMHQSIRYALLNALMEPGTVDVCRVLARYWTSRCTRRSLRVAT